MGFPGETSRSTYIYWEYCDFVAASPTTWTAHKFYDSHNKVVFSNRYLAFATPQRINHKGRTGRVQGNVAFGDGSVRWYVSAGMASTSFLFAADEY